MKQSLIWKTLFGLYCALMLWLLFDRPGFVEGIPYREQMLSNLNLVPFRTLKLFTRLLDSSHPPFVRSAIINLVGNVIMFIPLGLFLPAIWEKFRRLWKTLLMTALIITVVELLQLVTLVGSCDIDDLILNLIGAALGYWLFRISHK